ncbi:glycosyltransferase [Cyanobium sp. Morenito 9A2]|uniref:glycosyltransferase n=1 Tax=Cyanobium sp. Morenito 9A2 TaxID=2823718 RepID=UPI0020CC5190|nr:glycosyltransferase [Cyanobium sp. Morenito 9A2]MCP9849452.1 glucosyl transferase [Cyanobium sp. Morenito 9A2]
MILVTVGTEKFPFNRLMRWIERLIDDDLIGEEELVVQYGTCTFIPSGAKVYRLLREQDFEALVRRARVVMAHCGEGTVLLLDGLQTPYILVPRSQRYQEHVDDHQLELAQALGSIGVPIAWGPADLVRFLADPTKMSIGDLSVTAAQAVCHRLEQQFPA